VPEKRFKLPVADANALVGLAGVVVGVAGTAAVTYALRKRDETREVRSVARMLLPGLRSSVHLLDEALRNDHWELLQVFDLHEEVWRAHGYKLAAHLPESEWKVLEKAYRGSEKTPPMLLAMNSGDDLWKRPVIAKVQLDAWREGLAVLDRLA
jgi:hypothetical protein